MLDMPGEDSSFQPPSYSNIPSPGYTVFQIPKPSGPSPNSIEPENLSDSGRTLNTTAFKAHDFSSNTAVSAQNGEWTTKEIFQDKSDVKDIEETRAAKASDKGGCKSDLSDSDIDIRRLPGNMGIGVWTRVRIEAGQTFGPCLGVISQKVRVAF